MAYKYVDNSVGSVAQQNFVKLIKVNPEFSELPQINSLDNPFNYMLEVYMNDCIALAVPMSRSYLHHVSNSAMAGIHNMFPLDKYDDEYAMSLDIFLKKEGAWAVIKNVPGFDFDGNQGGHTICSTEDCRTNI